MRLFVVGCCSMMMAAVFAVPGAQGSVPHTGQTRCYDDSKEIACPAPGEPFYGQDGNYAHLRPPRYVKLDGQGGELPDTATEEDGWTMTRDERTGLVWQIRSADLDFRTYTYSWCDPDATTNGGNEGGCPGSDGFLATLNGERLDPAYGGRSDWRLPTVEEAVSILALDETTGPSFVREFFPFLTGLSYLWTAQTVAGAPELAYKVGVAFPSQKFNVGVAEQDFKVNRYHLLAVAGGRPTHDFVANGDGTVTDRGAGLMWSQRYLEGDFTWQEALAAAEAATLAGYDDWRLPSVKEWVSILDYTRSKPAIASLFPDPPSGVGFWTATTYAPGPTSAWYVRGDNATIFPKDKRQLYKVRLVRDIPASLAVGDVDGNGAVEVGDAILLLRLLAGLPIPEGTTIYSQAAVDGSGRLGLADIAHIFRLLADR